MILFILMKGAKRMRRGKKGGIRYDMDAGARYLS